MRVRSSFHRIAAIAALSPALLGIMAFGKGPVAPQGSGGGVSGITTPPTVATTIKPAVIAPLPRSAQITVTGVEAPKAPGGLTAIAPNKLSARLALARLKAERDSYFVNAQREVYRSTREVLAQDDDLQKSLRFSRITRGSRNKRQIALTFDDGPHPQYTPYLLKILKRYHVPATFFVVGSQAERYPDLVRAEVAAGHSVANHTYHHVSLPKIPQEYVADEIKACGKVVQAITGKSPRLFRPPGGEYNDDVAEAAAALGYMMVLWTDDPGDYASPGEDVILTRTLAKADNGGIILIHDGIQQTVNVLPRMIEALKAQGYEFVTVDQMLANRLPAARAAKVSEGMGNFPR